MCNTDLVSLTRMPGGTEPNVLQKSTYDVSAHLALPTLPEVLRKTSFFLERPAHQELKLTSIDFVSIPYLMADKTA